MKKILKTLTFAFAAILSLLTILFISPVEISGLLGGAFEIPVILGQSTHQQSPSSDKVVLGGSYVLDQDEILDGNLFILGGTAQLQSGSSVTGDVMVLGGTLVAQGEISGDVSILGGFANLKKGAHILGNVNMLSATLQRDDGAIVDGKTNEITNESWPTIIPKNLHLPNWQGTPPLTIPGETPLNSFSSPMKTGWDLLWLLVRSLAWAALAVLIALFGPKIISTASDTVVERPAAALGMGCATVFAGTAVLLLLIITICGIPFALAGGLLMALAWGFGVIAIGTETGIRFAKLFKADWAIPVSAGVGTFLLTIVTNAVGLLIPCMGGLLPIGIGLLGLGAAVLTRFGSRQYPLTPKMDGPERLESAQQVIDVNAEIDQPGEILPNQDNNKD
jgi:hypothetical protein